MGSGKSVVAHMLRIMGFRVYDTDSEAKRLMHARRDLLQALEQTFGPEIVCAQAGTIDRAALARLVFNNPEALGKLNSLVHGAVIEHVEQTARECNRPLMFVESAILVSSGLDKHCQGIWQVKAPVEQCIERVRERNGWTLQQIVERLQTQQLDTPAHVIITNDGLTPVLPQVLAALEREIAAC